MKAKSKTFLIIILVFILSGYLWFYKNKKEPVSNITISYEDSIIIPEKTNNYNLVDISTLPSNFIIELRYASENNFAGQQFYPKISKAYLQEKTAEKLVNANEELYKLGYRIKILDAYRPRRYQYDLRKAAADINPTTQGFIANPKTGSNHNKGVSVDITLTDLEGRELDMPTGFDHFGPESNINYDGCSKEQKKNRELLGEIMVKHGFRRIRSEWWHFDDVDYKDYPLLDVDFIDLQK